MANATASHFLSVMGSFKNTAAIRMIRIVDS